MMDKLIQLLCGFAVMVAVSAQCPTGCTCTPSALPTAYECPALDAPKLATVVTALKAATAVTSFKLTGYTGADMKADIFKEAPQLISLEITGSANLATLDANAFNGLTKLTALTISDAAKLTALPAEVFQPLKATLTTLTVTKTKVSQLPATIFDNLSKVTTLTLDENAFTNFKATDFEGVKTATVSAKKQTAFDCACNKTSELGNWIKDGSLKISIECNLPTALNTKMLGGTEWVTACPKTTTPQPKAEKTTTPEPEPGFPDWALVIIIAVIGAIIFVIIGVFCQLNKRKHYKTMKEREAEEGMPHNPQGYDNRGYMTN